MAECEKLLRAAGEMSAEATQIRETLAKTIEDVERHLSRLPTVAQGEAQRIRQMVQTETDEMLDLSARAISTIHTRNCRGARCRSPLQAAAASLEATEGEGLKNLARKLTQRPRKSTIYGAANSSSQPGRSQAERQMGNEDPAGGGGEQRPATRDAGQRHRGGDGRAAAGAGRHGGGSGSHRHRSRARQRGLEALSGGRPRGVRAQLASAIDEKRDRPHHHALSRGRTLS